MEKYEKKDIPELSPNTDDSSLTRLPVQTVILESDKEIIL